MKKAIFFLIFFVFSYANETTWTNPYKITDLQESFEIKNYQLDTHQLKIGDAEGLIHGKFEVFKEGQLTDISEKDASIELLLNGGRVGLKDYSIHKTSKGRYTFSFRLATDGSSKQYFLVINYPKFQFKDPNPIEFQRQKINFVFLIDASGSMGTNDANSKRIVEMNRTIEFYKDVLNHVSVISFATDAQILWDWKKVSQFNLFKRAVEKIHADGSTNIGLTFSKLYSYLKSKKIKKNETTKVIFLTDGNSSDVYNNEHLKLKKMGVTFYTIGFGQKGNYNEAFLKKIAEDSGGRFFGANEFDIGTVYHQIFSETHLNLKRVLNNDNFRSDEIVLFRLLGSFKKVHVVLNHQEMPILYQEIEGDETKIYLSPLAQGNYSGYLQYEDGGKSKREVIGLGVREAKKEFLLESDNHSWSFVKKSVFRIPFVLKNLSNQKRSYNLLTLTQTEFYKNFLLREKNLSLKSGEMKSLSLETNLSNSSGALQAVYLVIEDEGHFYPVDVSLKKSDQTESVLRLKDSSSQSFLGEMGYLLMLFILTVCFFVYVYVVKKAKKDVLW